MRLIDADALIERLKKDNPQTSKLKWAQILADNAPTIEPKTEEWIPCSERLPNEEGLYMATCKTFSDDYRFIDLFHYGKPMMPNHKVKGACWYHSDSEWGDVVYDDTDILAWMPLPKPYREDGEK